MRCGIISGLIIFTLFLVEGCASSDAALPDCYSRQQFARMVSPAFSWYIMNVAASGKSRIDVYLQMPYKKLRFQIDGEHYGASYSYTFLIKDKKNEIVHTKEIDRTVNVRTYEESMSLRSDFNLQTFQLIPGEYVLEIISRDNLSHLEYRAVQSLEVKDFSSPAYSASSVLLLDTITFDDKGAKLHPILPDYISLLDGTLGTFQEIYNVHAGDTVTVTMQYFRAHTDTAKEDDFTYWMPPYRMNNQPCKVKSSELYFTEDSTFVISKEGTVQFFHSYELPQTGYTQVKRMIAIHSSSGVDSVVRSFSLFRRDQKNKVTPSTDEILSALRYIAREEEIDSIASFGVEERQKKIAEFWETHGGIQRGHDFEKRVHEANQFFTSCVDGSRTPMGIIYIMCGFPDYIDCRGETVENWYYTIGDRAYAVQFRRADEDAVVPYYELVPFSLSDSFWQYYIDRWRRKN